MREKRVHGKLLVITGILHTIATLLPGIFGVQFISFLKSGLFNINKGISDFPLFGGEMNYANFAAFWFFYAGLFMIIIGLLFDYIEKIKGYITINLSMYFLIFSIVGAYMIPFSGMTMLLIPQAIYMTLRSIRNKKARTPNSC